MSRRDKTSFHTIGDINLTPMLDFAFLLLTVFLITYPLLEQGIHISLPYGQADDLKPEKNHSVSIDLKGQLSLDGKTITREKLNDAMLALGRSDPKATIYVRADKDIKYGSVIDIMKILREARITRMALVTQAE